MLVRPVGMIAAGTLHDMINSYA
ncbi:MAG: hypothetical protein JWL99_46, partial [Streptomyces oryziradicis]|nr:hypothetical protein [Actinacidiphila oryziradicis]